MSSLIRVSFTAALLVLAVAPASMVFAAEVFWGLSTDQKLVRFSDMAPGTPIAVLQVPEIVEGVFGVEIVSTIPIMVERSMYANSNGQLWSVGTNATGTRLPDADLFVYPWSSL